MIEIGVREDVAAKVAEALERGISCGSSEVRNGQSAEFSLNLENRTSSSRKLVCHASFDDVDSRNGRYEQGVALSKGDLHTSKCRGGACPFPD